MNIFKDKRTRVLIIVMGILVLVAITIAHFWFRFENQSADPRVVEANNLYAGYNTLALEADVGKLFALLDSIEFIYSSIPHYSQSYEVGVLYNNRAAICISMAISSDLNDSIVKDSLLLVAEAYVLKSIEIYSGWLLTWGELDKEQTMEMLIPCFPSNDPVFNGKDVNRFIRKRAKEIREASFETLRRLSAARTNLGIIYRHKMMYEEAVREYLMALEMWGDNLAAENNLNILMNKPLKKRSMFRKIFPKGRLER